MKSTGIKSETKRIRKQNNKVIKQILKNYSSESVDTLPTKQKIKTKRRELEAWR